MGSIKDLDKVVAAVVCGIIFLKVVQCDDGATISRGFNDNIKWVTFEEGQKLSTDLNKPMMLLVHKSWCGACKALKPQFAESKEIETLSEQFVMVNVMDDDEPGDAKYAPDGGYIPRILFIEPGGEVKTNIINEGGNDSYKYYYPSPDAIVTSMRRVLAQQSAKSSASDEL